MELRKFSGIPRSARVIGICALLAAGIWLVNQRGKIPSDSPAPLDGVRNTQSADSDIPQLRRRIDSASVKEYKALMKQLLGMKDPAAQKELMARLIGRWLDSDPKSFSVYLDEIMIGGEQVWNRLTPALIAALAGLDRQDANSFLIRGIVERTIVKAAETDPRNALEWAHEWLTGTHLDSALTSIAAELAEIDPEAAIAVIPEIKALSNRMEASSAVGMVLGEQNSDLGLSWAAAFKLEAERAYALSGVLSGMADRDSLRAAAEYSKTVETMKSDYRERVLADRAALGTSTEEEYEGLSPEEILKAELARPNPNLIYLEKAAYLIGTALARDNPQRALEWAEALDIYQGKVVAMEAVFEEWTANAPREAFNRFLLETDRRPDLAARVFTAWAANDPPAAAEAALSLDAGLEKDHAIEGVARGWMDSGATATEIARWSEQLVSASEKDRVLAIVASESAIDDPVFAMSQLEMIRNSAKRAELFHEVFPALAENNPGLARRALAGIGLSRVETEYFETMLEP